jgi:hypothetical protein
LVRARQRICHSCRACHGGFKPSSVIGSERREGVLQIGVAATAAAPIQSRRIVEVPRCTLDALRARVSDEGSIAIRSYRAALSSSERLWRGWTTPSSPTCEAPRAHRDPPRGSQVDTPVFDPNMGQDRTLRYMAAIRHTLHSDWGHQPPLSFSREGCCEKLPTLLRFVSQQPLRHRQGLRPWSE